MKEIECIERFSDGDADAWLEEVELKCKLLNIEDKLATVIPLRLTGEALLIYKSMPDKKKNDAKEIKAQLQKVFGLDSMKAYRLFSQRKLQNDETVYSFAADLERLASCAWIGQKTVALAFVAGLPDEVSSEIEILGKRNSFNLEELIEEAQIRINKIRNRYGGLMAAALGENKKGIKCYKCGKNGHVAYNCKEKGCEKNDKRRVCFKCSKPGHIAKFCNMQGNEYGEEAAPPLL